MSSSEVRWVGEHLEVAPPKRPKKLTGTRFATVLGLSPWATAFETWCAVTRTYEEPFEDTIYTVAGKTIEPKQAMYMKNSYLMDNLTTPTEVFGPDYFKTTYGDFFPKAKIFGGMWDYLLMGPKGKPQAVLEMKTSKRVEDWQDDVPEYYALQAALYAYLLGVDQVYMVASFLEPEDYAHPDQFQPSVKNTIVRPFRLSERYPHFDRLIQLATDWWNTHVLSGISPDFDEKKDAEILKALHTTTAEANLDVDALVAQAEAVQAELEKYTAQTAPLEKKLKALNAKIKEYMLSQIGTNKYCNLEGSTHKWVLTRSTTNKLDEQRLKDDGLYEKYVTPTDSYRMTVSTNNKEEK